MTLVMRKTRPDRPDRLANAYTAFPTFAALVDHCRAGYVPTLRNDGEAQSEIADMLGAMGLRSWSPS